MVPVFLVVWALVEVALFGLVSGPLGLHEGEVLLMARSVGGWLAEIGSVALSMAAPLAGCLLGLAAVRRGGRVPSLVAVVVNASLFLLVAYMFLDDVHMTYFPSWS